MRNSKIVSTRAGLPEVLVARRRTQEGVEQVSVSAFGNIGDEDYFVEEVYDFEHDEDALEFVRDYHIEDAIKFCEEQLVRI